MSDVPNGPSRTDTPNDTEPRTRAVAQFPATMGDLGVETAWKAVMGEAVEPNIDTGGAVVTSANAAEFK